MERLQSAIAKARAARQSLNETAATQDGARGTTTADSAQAIAQRVGVASPALQQTLSANEAWSALRQVHISDERLIQQRIVSVGRGPEAIEFDKLRTRVQQRMQSKGWTRLAITSPGPGCGKSTIALNLGFGLARQEGAQVMIFELDMRRPTFRNMLGISGGADLSRALSGKEPMADNLIGARENLAIAPVGRVIESAELLHSASTASVLDQVQAQFDPSMMLFDLPPYNVSDDAISFMDKVDCVMIVAAAGQTSIDDLDNCERELSAQTEILGVVLNKCRYNRRDGDYYYSD